MKIVVRIPDWQIKDYKVEVKTLDELKKLMLETTLHDLHFNIFREEFVLCDDMGSYT